MMSNVVDSSGMYWIDLEYVGMSDSDETLPKVAKRVGVMWNVRASGGTWRRVVECVGMFEMWFLVPERGKSWRMCRTSQGSCKKCCWKELRSLIT